MEGEQDSSAQMPQYIAQVPWYMDDAQGGLNHQKSQRLKKKAPITTWYQKGVKVGGKVTKFRSGACTNCGAMTHDTKNCCERPRKVGAKWSGRDFSKDELIEQIDLDWEGKKDRWNGYQPDMYNQKLDEWNDERSGSDIEADAIKRAQEEAGDRNKDYAHSQLLNKIDPRTKTTTRNWRQREDVAGYLRNLDAETAGYDGKTRALKEYAVGRELDQEDDQLYRDSWMKISGDMEKLVEEEDFAQKAADKGAELHPTADPSLTEMMFKTYKEKQQELKHKKASKVVNKYGGREHMHAPDEVMNQPEPIEVGKPTKKPKTSEYPEDVLVLGHKAIWGSWFDRETQLWGYACCKTTYRETYCPTDKKLKQ